jgi:Sugar efflux transporter for intercellular exchange
LGVVITLAVTRHVRYGPQAQIEPGLDSHRMGLPSTTLPYGSQLSSVDCVAPTLLAGNMTGGAAEIVLQYVCPSLGCLMASIMFAGERSNTCKCMSRDHQCDDSHSCFVSRIKAPVQDLRRCLIKGELGDLNPFPFVMMTGNCLGWTVYGHYTRDPFVVAANIPGLVLSLWMNTGAAKLQYHAAKRVRRHAGLPSSRIEEWDAVGVESHEHSAPDAVPGDLTPCVDLSHDEDLVMVPQERALLRILCLWVVVIVYVGWFTKSDPAALVGLVVNVNLVFFYGVSN